MFHCTSTMGGTPLGAACCYHVLSTLNILRGCPLQPLFGGWFILPVHIERYHGTLLDSSFATKPKVLNCWKNIFSDVILHSLKTSSGIITRISMTVFICSTESNIRLRKHKAFSIQFHLKPAGLTSDSYHKFAC